ncbi:hypothetical protein D3C71_1332040 [compost metagenome]
MRYGQLQVHLLCMQQTLAGGDGDADQQSGDHRITGEQAAAQQPRSEHGQRQHALGVHCHEHVQAEAQQHTGQHARGQGHGHALHQPGEHPREAREHAQHRRKQECTGGFRQRRATGTDDQHRRARRRPCGDHRHAVAQRQADAGHAHAQPKGPHPRGDVRLVGTDRLRRLEHDHRRTGEADQHGDEAGDDRRHRKIPPPSLSFLRVHALLFAMHRCIDSACGVARATRGQRRRRCISSGHAGCRRCSVIFLKKKS